MKTKVLDIESQAQKFLTATLPPEPRGAAYLHTSEYTNFFTVITLPNYQTKMNEKYFLFLFSKSVSLRIDEKRDMMSRIPILSQFQINGLIKILEEEKQKFDQLELLHPKHVIELRRTTMVQWFGIELNKMKEKTQDSISHIIEKNQL